MRNVDVVIIGAGPAGATAGMNLAPFWRVLIVERFEEPIPRIGDSLAPAARRLLTDMGIWEAFLSDGHSPWYLARSTWGDVMPSDRDSIANADGSGWQLDRSRFESRLRSTAISRGAVLVSPARAMGVTRLPLQGERRFVWIK